MRIVRKLEHAAVAHAERNLPPVVRLLPTRGQALGIRARFEQLPHPRAYRAPAARSQWRPVRLRDERGHAS